jgi:hypothetical protein
MVSTNRTCGENFCSAMRNAQWIPQRAAKNGEPNFHHIAIGKLQAVAETQRARAEKMDMQIARAAVRFKFEMMMLDVREAVAHFTFAGENFLRPKNVSGTFDFHRAGNGIELRVNHKFRTERAIADF